MVYPTRKAGLDLGFQAPLVLGLSNMWTSFPNLCTWFKFGFLPNHIWYGVQSELSAVPVRLCRYAAVIHVSAHSFKGMLAVVNMVLARSLMVRFVRSALLRAISGASGQNCVF